MELGMQAQAMGYDRTPAMFSPEGHLLQVEYAAKTVKLGAASIGMMCSDGVIIVSDKRIKDELMLPSSAAKIYEIDNHIGATAAGILSDARTIIDKVQVYAQQHKITYDTPIDTEVIVKEMADIQQLYTAYGGTRPLGINIMLAGIDNDDSIHLFTTDVMGNYYGYKATSIGENDDKIKEMLRKEYKLTFTIEQGIASSLNIFSKILGKNFDIMRFEAAIIKKKDKTFKRVVAGELQKYIKS